jgi:GNAT acetyltransferase-like protein
MGTEAMAFEGELALEIHEGEAPPGWDDALLAAGGVVFHSEAWAFHKAGDEGADTLYCRWRKGASDEVVGRGLAIRRPGRSSLAGRLVSKVSFDSPPATAAAGSDFVSPLAAWARKTPALIEVGLGSFDALGPWQDAPLPRPRLRCEYVIPAGGEDELWSGMRQLARRKVKRAMKNELECREVRGPGELGAFAEVYRATEERLQRDKDYVPGSALDSEEFATSLSQLIDRGNGKLYAAFSDGRLEAGTMFATFGKRAYMIYSGATDGAREMGAPFLVMYTGLKELRDAGYEHINLGGAGGDAADPESADHGLHLFKTRFGAEVEARTSGSLALRPLRAKLVEGGRRLVRR